DHDTSRQLVPELRREDQPTLVVQPRSVGAEKHGPTPLWCCPPGADRTPRSRHKAPLYSTPLHPQWKTSRTWRFPSKEVQVRSRGDRWRGDARRQPDSVSRVRGADSRTDSCRSRLPFSAHVTDAFVHGYRRLRHRRYARWRTLASVTTPSPDPSLPLRTKLAATVSRGVGALSRATER